MCGPAAQNPSPLACKTLHQLPLLIAKSGTLRKPQGCIVSLTRRNRHLWPNPCLIPSHISQSISRKKGQSVNHVDRYFAYLGLLSSSDTCKASKYCFDHETLIPHFPSSTMNTCPLLPVLPHFRLPLHQSHSLFAHAKSIHINQASHEQSSPRRAVQMRKTQEKKPASHYKNSTLQ